LNAPTDPIRTGHVIRTTDLDALTPGTLLAYAIPTYGPAPVAYQGPVGTVRGGRRRVAITLPDGTGTDVPVRTLRHVTAGHAPCHGNGRLPYTTAACVYIAEPRRVHVLWAEDPAMAVRLAVEGIGLWERLSFTDHDSTQLIAVATRHTIAGGDTFSGWVVRCGGDDSDVLPNRQAMLSALRTMVADRLR
jgi:hypothetical protein